MVRQISERNNFIYFGTVSLSVNDLLEIIERLQLRNVKAKNGTTAFDDLADMKKNKASLAGSPTISSDEVSLSFDRGFFGPSIYTPSKDDAYAKAKSLEAELKTKKTFFDIARKRQKFVTFPYWILMIVFIISSFQLNTTSIYYEYLKEFSFFMSLYSWAILCLYMNWGYIQFFRTPVYFRASEGFWKRNLEKIFLLLVGALLTVGVNMVIDRLHPKVDQCSPSLVAPH